MCWHINMKWCSVHVCWFPPHSSLHCCETMTTCWQCLSSSSSSAAYVDYKEDGVFPKPPSYNVATTLPSYDEAERTKAETTVPLVTGRVSVSLFSLLACGNVHCTHTHTLQRGRKCSAPDHSNFTYLTASQLHRLQLEEQLISNKRNLHTTQPCSLCFTARWWPQAQQLKTAETFYWWCEEEEPVLFTAPTTSCTTLWLPWWLV